MKVDLKKKIMFGSFIMLVMVMAISTIVVSNIVAKQNRDASNSQIKKSFNIIVDDIVKKREKLLSDSAQMSSLNDMRNHLKFIIQESDMEFSVLQNSYSTMAINMYNIGQTSDISKVGIYGMDRDLLGYFYDNSEASRVGYIYGKKTVKEATLKPGQSLDSDSWKEIEKPSDIPLKFEGVVPEKKTLKFEIVDNLLSIVSYIPMIADDYNSKTEKMEPVQFGILMAVQYLDESFVTRLANLVEAKVNIFANEALISGVFKEYENLDMKGLELTKKVESLEAQEVYLNEADINGQGFFQGIIPIYSDTRHIASIATLISKEISRANAWEMIKLLIIVALGCIVLFIPVIYFLTGTIVNPVKKVVNGLKDVAEGEGDLTKRLHITSTDEVGNLAKWFNIFMERLQGMIKDITDNADNLNKNSGDLSNISNQMSLNTEQMSSKSNIVAGSTEEMSNNMNSVAAAMEEASTNINMVASAAEEMTATINEIAQNSEKARSVTRDAVNSAKSTSERVGELGKAAKEIDKVTEAITEISEQTNLLALNATIEAARAGEAGKGFAVVANEIKELARQTAKATQEIKEKIDGIQLSTEGTIAEIGQILTVINDVSEIVSSIATAVEEQSVTTKEIAGNVAQASDGIGEVNQNVSQSSNVANEINHEITVLNQVAMEMSNSGSQVNLSSTELSNLAGKLKEMVNQFKV